MLLHDDPGLLLLQAGRLTKLSFQSPACPKAMPARPGDGACGNVGFLDAPHQGAVRLSGVGNLSL